MGKAGHMRREAVWRRLRSPRCHKKRRNARHSRPSALASPNERPAPPLQVLHASPPWPPAAHSTGKPPPAEAAADGAIAAATAAAANVTGVAAAVGTAAATAASAAQALRERCAQAAGSTQWLNN